MTDCDSETAPSRADCLELLASERRRTVVAFLAGAAATEHSLNTVASAIADTERECERAVSPTEHVCITLHHVHLPKLDDAGVLNYDPSQNVVRYLGSPRLEAILERLEETAAGVPPE